MTNKQFRLNTGDLERVIVHVLEDAPDPPAVIREAAQRLCERSRLLTEVEPYQYRAVLRDPLAAFVEQTGNRSRWLAYALFYTLGVRERIDVAALAQELAGRMGQCRVEKHTEDDGFLSQFK